MRALKTIFDYIFYLIRSSTLNNEFSYPYSQNKTDKRNEIWNNLQRGLLLEDNNTFINWGTSYKNLDKYKEQKRHRGDRIEWYLGKHSILDGYESHLEVMKWIDISSKKPICQIDENIGTDYQGYNQFKVIREHISNLLGKPTKIDLENWGDFELGIIEWTNKKVTIALVGVEIFNCRYSLSIGLKNRQEK